MERKIVKIDEAKCNGCGECIKGCHEGALKIVNGKAKLSEDFLCDGLGACIGKCPEGAITIEVRDAAAFDEKKVKEHLKKEKLPCGCPGTMMKDMRNERSAVSQGTVFANAGSELRQWPVQLKLLSPLAPYFEDAELVITADCVLAAYPNFHQRFLRGKIMVLLCPKLDDAYDDYVEKLAAIIRQNNIKCVTVVHMEVPCCGGTTVIVEEAVKASGKQVVIKDHTVSLKGELV